MSELAGKYGFLLDPAFKTLSPDLQKQVFAGETSRSDIEALGGLLDRFSDPERMRQQLELATAFDKERMKDAAKYKMLLDLPRQLTAAYTIPAAIEAEGAANVANIMTGAGANIANLANFQRGAYSYAPARYF